MLISKTSVTKALPNERAKDKKHEEVKLTGQLTGACHLCARPS
jgi:hypothetical protein